MSAAIQRILEGRVVWIFGDDFDVDLIIGVENIKYYDPDILASVCMKSYDPDFLSQVKAGDVIVGGRNFGYGHPHYPAMISLRNAGVVAVIAESFAPGFWRGEIYQGMPLVTIPGISSAVSRWDTLIIDWRAATVINKDSGQKLEGKPPSAHTIDVIEAGGGYQLLINQYGTKAAVSSDLSQAQLS